MALRTINNNTHRAAKKIGIGLLAGICLILTICVLFEKHTASTQTSGRDWAMIQNSVNFSELYQDKIETLKNAYASLSAINSYIECGTQFLDIADFWFSKQFIYAYEVMSDEERGQYEDMSRDGTIYPVQAVQISKNCIDFFDITTSTGRLFTNEDMNYTKGSVVPILVGSSYSEFLSVGSTFNGSYILNDLELNVVGILSAGSNITINGVPLYLDDYIIMPSFDCITEPQSEEEEIFQVRHYVNKLSGMYQRTDNEKMGIILQELNTLGIGSFS